jgi:hypothetical protein
MPSDRVPALLLTTAPWAGQHASSPVLVNGKPTFNGH